MLTIYTDLTDTGWLVYVLEEFKRINVAKFEIQVQSINDVQQNSNSIFYTKNISGKNTICNLSSNEYGELISKEPQLYIYENTLVKNNGFLLDYDLFWNTFLIISRYEEFQAEKNGHLIRSYCSRHPRINKDSFKVPLVNIYFNILEEIIQKLFPELIFGKMEHFTIEPSHDVDYINKTLQLIIKQTAFNAYNTLRSVFNPRKFLQNVKLTITYPFKKPSYFCFDFWINLEKRKGARSVFNFYIKTGKKNFKQWLLDPSYDLRKNARLREKITEMAEDGFKIGLHGSFNSANNGDLLKKEKEVLEETINMPVNRVRQHWLNYTEKNTPYFHNEHFEIDSTLGWNDVMGFRSGCASKYRPWDHINNKPFSYFVVPQILMDSTIFDYSQKEEAIEEALNMLKGLRNFKNVHVSISWHQRTCSSDYNWHYLYEKIIDECI